MKDWQKIRQFVYHWKWSAENFLPFAKASFSINRDFHSVILHIKFFKHHLDRQIALSEASAARPWMAGIVARDMTERLWTASTKHLTS